ncbi:hypothetical protein BC936DRAFT_147814 [Jimgerdemannia flammicorona]|uniref:J domain-containing protein n=1 Tax=Jimgerdemannia flammicorona TaxID=994334 RepID=A0A433D4F2_9FUNG|nr:hypothetical protein BC936DRAFT_147814 [Jimgerdemannia flammicorona]
MDRNIAMDRNTTQLYETLGLPKSASQDDIKKAYKRLALRYHPDKNPNAADEFRAIKHAYDILSDPKKREVYDRHGELGVNMMNTLASPLFDPHIESMLCTFFSTASLLFVLVIIFFSFLSVRIENIVQWSYSVVFIPLWIVDTIVLGVVFLQFLQSMSGNSEDEQDDADEEDNEEDGEGASSEEERKTRRDLRRNNLKRWNRFRNAVTLLYFSLIVLFQVFIVLRLDGWVELSAAIIFIPYFVVETINLFPNIFNYILTLQRISASADEGRLTFTTNLTLFFANFWWFAIRLVQAVLLVLRLDGVIPTTCSWAIVFIPLYLIGLKYAIQLVLAYRAFSRIPEFEVATQGKMSVMLGAVALFLFGAPFYTVIGLLVTKLDGSSISMSNVLIPVFLVLSILLCCAGICMPCMLCVSRASFDDMDEGAAQSLVDPSKRITQSGEPMSMSSQDMD